MADPGKGDRIEKVLTDAVGELLAGSDYLVDHVLVVYTYNSPENEDGIGIMTTKYMPRWVVKGMLMDALDIVREVE